MLNAGSRHADDPLLGAFARPLIRDVREGGRGWVASAGSGGTTFPARARPAAIRTCFPFLARTAEDLASACSRMPSTSVICLLSAGPRRQRITTGLPASARVSRTSAGRADQAGVDDDDLIQWPVRGQPADQIAGIADGGHRTVGAGRGQRAHLADRPAGGVEAENAGGRASRCRPAEYQDLPAAQLPGARRSAVPAALLHRRADRTAGNRKNAAIARTDAGRPRLGGGFARAVWHETA